MLSTTILGMTTLSKTSLGFRHPNLFKTLLSIVFVNFTIAFFLVTGEAQNLINFSKIPDQGIVPPLWAWAIGFFVAGLFVLGGVFTKYYRLTRYGLTMCAGIGAFWAFGFIINYLTGEIRGISAPILWTFYTLICMTVASEPAANPLSATLQHDIKATMDDHASKVKKNGMVK